MAQASKAACIDVRRDGGATIVTLDRPEKNNAIDRAMYTDLVEILQDAEDDSETLAVILAGRGSYFTAGNDLKDFSDLSIFPQSGAPQIDENPILAFLDTYRKFPKPLIAAIQGDAIGIGTTLLLHSDLCFASSNAHFCLPFVKLGLCPEFASSYLLPRLVGHVKAFEWLVLGRPFSAFEAHTFGLINAVVDEPLEYAITMAHSLSQLPPHAVVEAKRLIKSASLKPIDRSIAIEIQQFSKALKGPEFAAATKAFFDKGGN